MLKEAAEKIAEWGSKKAMNKFKSVAKAGVDGVVFNCDCGQKNRVPFSVLGKTGKCGKCQSALATSAVPIDVMTSASLKAMAKESPIPVVVDFWSPSCGPCLIGLPRVEEAAAKSEGVYVMVRINLESAPTAAAGYDVKAIPTMVRLLKGMETARSVGLHSTADMIKFAKTGN